SISQFAEPGSPDYVRLVLTLTFMVGVMELAMGLLRMGALVNFISHTVAIGFTAGAAILIAANQVKHFFGLDIERGTPFYEIVQILFRSFAEISPETTAIGLVTVLAGLLAKRFLRAVPYMIVAMVAASAFAAVLNGFFDADVPTVGALPSGLPPLSTPYFSVEIFHELGTTAVAVALFALTEAVSISRALAVRSGQQIDGNQEFIGQGLSNLAGSFFSGYVATGSFNRSGLNYEAGARTPLAAVSAGILLMPIVVLAAPYASFLPKAAVAGILFLVAYGLIDIPHIRQILVSSRSESTVMAATFFSVLFLDLEIAIFVGVVLSLAFYLNRTSHPNVATLAPNPDKPRRRLSTDPGLTECPQVKIVRIDGSLYFGAVSSVIEKLRGLEKRKPRQVHLVVVASGINFIDSEGAETLVAEARRREQAGGRLYLVDLHESVALSLERGGYLDAIGRDNVFDSKTAALAAIYGRLNKDVCADCTARIFRECADGVGVSTAAEGAPPDSLPVLTPPLATAKAAPIGVTAPASPARPSAAPRPHSRPPRILALIDFGTGAHDTALAALELARHTGAELALGHVSSCDWSSGHDFQPGLISDEAFNGIREAGRRGLAKIAAKAGIDNPILMASATPDRQKGIRELVGNWRPETLVVNRRSDYEISDRPTVSLDTPTGTIRCRVRRVGHAYHGAEDDDQAGLTRQAS
ncbi:MAG: SulP family inorganic anion transporter, partial [Rhodospirillales bacterium]|nr:SulP family inorganic anion transporter [Rhodospirillales bacterium]